MNRARNVKMGQIFHIILGHSLPVTSLCFNPDRSLIVWGSHDGSCKISNIMIGVCLKVFIDGKIGIYFAKFSPKGKFILVGTLDILGKNSSLFLDYIYMLHLI
ncbi:COMPASS-like H3K4 histone methylase component WDR5B [Bienertia sinuspersici]